MRNLYLYVLIIILSIIFIHSFFSFAFGASDGSAIKIVLEKDATMIGPGEEINFRVASYIENILILSIPSKIEISTPSNVTTEYNLSGSFTGIYELNYAPNEVGTYNVKALIEKDGKENSISDTFIVSKQEFLFDIDIG